MIYISFLKNIEIETELEHIIPITSNINKINDGDIIVSDMYLQKEILLKFIKKVGIKKNIELFVSPNGKHTGKIWNIIFQKYNIISHTGDNLHSDIDVPKKMYNINTIITNIYKYTKLENDIPLDVANIIREFRLRNPYDEYSNEFLLYDEQCQSNIMLLCLFSCQINNIVIKESLKKILFCTRDCCLLYKLFHFLFPQHTYIIYNTSRVMNKNYNNEYIEYIKSVYSIESIIIDLQGSFESGRKLYLETFNELPRVHILCFNNKAPIYNKLSFSCKQTMNDYMELLNTDKIGTLIKYSNGNFIRTKNENEKNMHFINIAHDTFQGFLDFIEYNNHKTFLIKSLQEILSNKILYQNIFSSKYFTYSYKKFFTNK
jgi:hypothetical protein